MAVQGFLHCVTSSWACLLHKQPYVSGGLQCICWERLGFSQICQRKLDLSGHKICWPLSPRLTFSFMFHMTHFKLQCSADIERSLPFTTLPQTPHNGKSKNFLHKQGIFFFFFLFLPNKKASLWGDFFFFFFFSARIPTGPLSQSFTKGHDGSGRPIWRLCLCTMRSYICISALGIGVVLFEPLS